MHDVPESAADSSSVPAFDWLSSRSQVGVITPELVVILAGYERDPESIPDLPLMLALAGAIVGRPGLGHAELVALLKQWGTFERVACFVENQDRARLRALRAEAHKLRGEVRTLRGELQALRESIKETGGKIDRKRGRVAALEKSVEDCTMRLERARRRETALQRLLSGRRE